MSELYMKFPLKCPCCGHLDCFLDVLSTICYKLESSDHFEYIKLSKMLAEIIEISNQIEDK